MTRLPISSATSTAAGATLVSRVDAAREALQSELLSLGLPGPIGEGCSDSNERDLSAARNRTGCRWLGAGLAVLDDSSDGLVVDGTRYYPVGASAEDVLRSFGRVQFGRSL